MPKSTEIAGKIESTIPDLQQLSYDAELLAAQKASALLLARVFSDGAKDVNNKQLSPYSKPYAKKREKEGRQIQKKDLQFTGALFESIQVGTQNEKPVVGYLTERSAQIGGYQEEQNNNVAIFSLNDTERAEVAADVKDFVINRLREIVQRWY